MVDTGLYQLLCETNDVESSFVHMNFDSECSDELKKFQKNKRDGDNPDQQTDVLMRRYHWSLIILKC